MRTNEDQRGVQRSRSTKEQREAARGREKQRVQGGREELQTNTSHWCAQERLVVFIAHLSYYRVI